jgi:hypothetical protein
MKCRLPTALVAVLLIACAPEVDESPPNFESVLIAPNSTVTDDLYEYKLYRLALETSGTMNATVTIPDPYTLNLAAYDRSGAYQASDSTDVEAYSPHYSASVSFPVSPGTYFIELDTYCCLSISYTLTCQLQ